MILPALDTASTISGSGLFQVDTGCSPASAPSPTEDIGCALVKISASGPMPTSRYCDHAPFSIKTCFNAIACSEPGLSLDRSSPISAVISRRNSTAASALPRARSSITRSSMEVAKVTPAALIACKSNGARMCGSAGLRVVSPALAISASRVVKASPLALPIAPAGSAVSHKSRMVGKAADISTTSSPRSTQTEGPPKFGRQTRNASAPTLPSLGRTADFCKESGDIDMVAPS